MNEPDRDALADAVFKERGYDRPAWLSDAGREIYSDTLTRVLRSLF
jgi:hypothetical protein